MFFEPVEGRRKLRASSTRWFEVNTLTGHVCLHVVHLRVEAEGLSYDDSRAKYRADAFRSFSRAEVCASSRSGKKRVQ
jgi:hypothetical protein